VGERWFPPRDGAEGGGGARLIERWGLTLGEPFEGGVASVVVAPAVTAEGEDVVLKVQEPHRESEHETAALELWDGEGAIRLLDHDPEEHALLLERCVPGTPLAAAGADAAMDVFVELLPRLWKPAGAPFRPLAEEAAWWLESLEATWERAGRPFERRLLDAALGALRELPPTQGEQVLLHQDLHGENVLAAQREPWLAIDPKPLAGEREFGLAPIIRSVELGHSRAEVVGRLERLSSELGLDRERARGWAIGQTIAWAFNSTYHATHVDTARWLLEAA
jgi:streptomycin 6-kinase